MKHKQHEALAFLTLLERYIDLRAMKAKLTIAPLSSESTKEMHDLRVELEAAFLRLWDEAE